MASTRSEGFAQSAIPDGYARYLLTQLFEPWAVLLADQAELRPGQSVLDVASGLGPVARLAAAAAGPQGQVVASDISPAMLQRAAARPAGPGAAPVEFRAWPASALEAADGSFDAVLCQHGVQFFADRAAALAEMRRVLRPGGRLVLSTWAAEYPLGLFGPMAEALAGLGIPEPYPRAFDPASYQLSTAELTGLLAGAGLREVQVRTAECDAVWDTDSAAASTVLGTPFGPLVTALPAAAQAEWRGRFLGLLRAAAPGGHPGGVAVRTVSHLARGLR